LKRGVALPARRPAFQRPELAPLLAAGDWPGAVALLAGSRHPDDREPLAFLRRFADWPDAQGAAFLHPHASRGRVEHFHHYVGAILLPVMELIDVGALAGSACVAPDCGPMNVTLQAVADHFGLRLEFYPMLLGEALARSPQHRHFHLPPHDHTGDSDAIMRPHQIARMRRVAFAVAGIADGERPADWTTPSVLLVNRAAPHPYYASDRYRHSANPEGLAGSDRRVIPNVEELRAALGQHAEVRLAHLEEMRLPDQIRAFNDATVIVAQHGAGLDGLYWSRPGGLVIEIIPVGKLRGQYTVFGNLADRLGVRHYHVVQAEPRDPVDVALVARYLAAELRSRNG
jgi:hypothetical protein